MGNSARAGLRRRGAIIKPAFASSSKIASTVTRKLLALLLLVVLPCSQLFAWGAKGHQITGDIARDHLTPAARQNLIALLGNDDLGAISSWADEVRQQHPEASGWHYVDIPRDAAGFSEERDCYKPDQKHPTSLDDHHNCVVDRIKMFNQILGDKNSSQEARVKALKFLVHFVEDIHQPLHAIDEARGGNDVHVSEFGSTQCGKYPCNLHYEWDTGLLEHTGRSEQEYVAYLEKMIADKKLAASGTPEDWANESHQLATQVWLNDGGTVDEAYYKANIGIVDQRLALAGLRLAALLNRTLG